MTHSSELEAQDVRDKVAVHTQSVPLFLFETVAEKEEEQHAEDNRVPIAAVVLNNRLPPSFGAIWAKATLRVCADGGSNRVYDHFMQSGCDEGSEPQLPPHFIVGDLDSARVATLSHFRGLGTEVIHDPDQDSDDITKALRLTLDKFYAAPERHQQPLQVFILGAMGRSLTQELANFNVFFTFANEPRPVELFMVSKHNVAWLLKRGRNVIACPHSPPVGRTTALVVTQREPAIKCGLLPIGGPCARVTTRGLRWDVDGRMEYGVLVSSSNEVCSRSVVVETTDPLLWCVDLRC
eukprot:TRINITY_DN4937_c0_g1_i4.p1 TRINITY_DN4937_c0_g1~~TRINITY_DN4937_c0_g1_i4.p1  ORF type:complete len:294 (-),score=69.69 TRINITY_DN4937_c0_g1_i4:294-1175(-)